MGQNRLTFHVVSSRILNAAAKDGTACPMAFAESMEPHHTLRVRAPTQAIEIACHSAIEVCGVQEHPPGFRASQLTRICLNR